MIEPWKLQISLGESFTGVYLSPPTETYQQRPALSSDAPAPLEGPGQEDEHSSLHDPFDDAPASTSEAAGDVPASPSKISVNTPLADT